MPDGWKKVVAGAVLLLLASVAPTVARRLETMRGRAISTAALKASAAYLAATENLARVRGA